MVVPASLHIQERPRNCMQHINESKRPTYTSSYMCVLEHEVRRHGDDGEYKCGACRGMQRVAESLLSHDIPTSS